MRCRIKHGMTRENRATDEEMLNRACELTGGNHPCSTNSRFQTSVMSSKYYKIRNKQLTSCDLSLLFQIYLINSGFYLPELLTLQDIYMEQPDLGLLLLDCD